MWETVCIDLIGPYTIGKGKKEAILHCLTMIDPATGWFEIKEVDGKGSDEIANQFEMNWLNRYPWPSQVVMVLDNPELLLAQVGGAPLAALEIADADLQKVRREFLAVLSDLNADHLAAAAKWEKLEKPELARLFSYLHTWVCDLIVVRATGAAQFHPDQLRGLEAIGKHANLPRLFRYESELRQQRRSIMHPLNARLLLEQLLLSYRQAVQ